MTPFLLRVSHVPQHRTGECLAACAAMVLTYMGLPARYEPLLRLLRVKPGIGAASFNIRELEKLGVGIVYKQGTLEELHNQLAHDRPCIVFVKTSELPYWDTAADHAVVVVGLEDRYIYLNDPAFSYAPVEVPHGDFGLAWQGRDNFYAVLMPPG